MKTGLTRQYTELYLVIFSIFNFFALESFAQQRSIIDRAPTARSFINVAWECPQTHAHPDLPTHREFRLPLRVDRDLNRTVVDVMEFRSFLNSASRSRVDYFPCMQTFLVSAERALQESCGGACGPQYSAATTELRYIVSNAGQNAFIRSTLPTVIPMQHLNPSLSQRQVEALVAPFTRGYDCSTGFRSGLNLAPLLSADFIERGLPLILTSASSRAIDHCANQLAIQLLEYLSQQQRPNFQCPSRVDPMCAQLRRGTADYIRALAERSPEVQELSNSLLSECFDNESNPGRRVEDLANGISRASRCISLNRGESAIVDGDMGTATQSRYRLTRTSPNQYIVDIRLLFQPSDWDPIIRTRVSRCLTRVNPFLTGPNGQSLTLRLSSDQGVPINRVRRLAAGMRSSSNDWQSNINCASITHEIMHLLGLVDEYPEVSFGYSVNPETGAIEDSETHSGQTGASCRRLGPYNSLMSHHGVALEEAEATLFPWETRRSLLYPAQFRSIVRPGCFDENKVFYLCARESVRESRNNFGEGCSRTLPPECRVSGPSEEWLR